MTSRFSDFWAFQLLGNVVFLIFELSNYLETLFFWFSSFPTTWKRRFSDFWAFQLLGNVVFLIFELSNYLETSFFWFLSFPTTWKRCFSNFLSVGPPRRVIFFRAARRGIPKYLAPTQAFVAATGALLFVGGWHKSEVWVVDLAEQCF